MELAVATNTGPDQWREQTDATLATALDVLARQADAIRKGGK